MQRLPISHEYLFVLYCMIVILQMWAWHKGKELGSRQNVVKGVYGFNNRSAFKTFFVWISFGLAIFGISFFINNDFYFDTFVGGFVTMQAAWLVLSLDTIWTWKLMGTERMVEGSIQYSIEYAHKRLANQSISMGIFCVFVGILTHIASFLAAAVFLAASASGQLRKMKQDQKAK